MVTSGQRALASGWRDDSQRAEGRQGQTGDQAGGQADGRRGACTTVLDGAAEEGQSGHEGREATGGGKKRRRKGGEQAEDPGKPTGKEGQGGKAKGGGGAKGRARRQGGEHGRTGKSRDKGGRGAEGTDDREL